MSRPPSSPAQLSHLGRGLLRALPRLGQTLAGVLVALLAFSGHSLRPLNYGPAEAKEPPVLSRPPLPVAENRASLPAPPSQQGEGLPPQLHALLPALPLGNPQFAHKSSKALALTLCEMCRHLLDGG